MRTARTPGQLRAEVLIVLGVSLGQSAVYSLLALIDKLTQRQALSAQTTTMNSSVTPDRPWLDLSYQLVNIAFPLVPVVLAFYLLSLDRSVGSARSGPASGLGTGFLPRTSRPWRLIGFDLRRPLPDLVAGLLIAVGIGIPGLGLYLGARALGLNTTVAASALTDHWWTVPVLVLAAAENAVLEETIMLGFLFTRFRQLGWRIGVIIAVSATIRGSYHLYQGFGGFVGNLIMGVIFGFLYTRFRRVMPMVVTHTLLDVTAFVGYALVAPYVSWL
ncbi:membrane protease YdiL (CAAX protease family) [Friedmanniella endophytica]|uniref:Membrane protease YdiL (CAAX protease family) n=1 Tax=Microlunatus kandeliicorticis TaxID=1759536 RepID=A0A7W3P4D2_9ACTN|nr:type II CAAX endopeptidase family protein [Microlunatus kandeliicorticis]MBA8792747.1 membrane protease YdiL (CAAX protease family) [Microlunatus kandeliicorticis]